MPKILPSKSYLRKSTIIPYVSMIRKTVVNVSQFSLLAVLLDRVKCLFGGDLSEQI